MDMRDPDAALQPYLRNLESLPFVRRVRVLDSEGIGGGGRFDALLELTTPDSVHTFLVELRTSHLSTDLVPHVISLGHGVPHLLLMAPSIGRSVAEELASAGIDYVDRAGNCFVSIDGRYIARIEGRRGDWQASKEHRALRQASYHVLFALLARPHLVGTAVREIAKQAGGVSAQTASDLRHELVRRQFLSTIGRTYEWNPTRWSEAIDLFVQGYLTGVRARLVVGRYRARDNDPDELERRIESTLGERFAWAFGGGAAAMRLTGYYRGSSTVLHVQDPPPDLGRTLHLVPDAAGPVVICRSIGPCAFEGAAPRAVHPLLAYGDLLAEANERATEAAAELRHQYLGAPPRKST